jgi:hypothetical protein
MVCGMALVICMWGAIAGWRISRDIEGGPATGREDQAHGSGPEEIPGPRRSTLVEARGHGAPSPTGACVSAVTEREWRALL